MSPTVYLGELSLTGANRGIGLALVEQLAARPNTVVFAGVRSYPLPAGSDLGKLASRAPEVVVPIQITSADEAGNAAAAEVVRSKVGKVDVIIANAGTHSGHAPMLSVTPAQLEGDFRTNSIGTVVLFQAFAPLLLAAGGAAKFVAISSILAQITDSYDYPFNAYGGSKSALNYFVKKIDQEFPQIIAFPINPGVVDTDMAREAAVPLGVTVAEIGGITPEQSAAGMLAVIDNATKKSHGGKFWDEQGRQMTY